MSCVGVRSKRQGRQLVRQWEKDTILAQSFSGFALYDPEKKQFIAQQNAEKYFTPASNTKIFTLYTALHMLGDSVPALKYEVRHDSLIFWGTGDPSFLHPDLHSTKAYQFLLGRKEKLVFSPTSYFGHGFGPGWSWDDYNDYYSIEKAAFPIYGNIARFGIDENQTISIQPRFFKSNLTIDFTKSRESIVRDRENNYFRYYPDSSRVSFSKDVPFRHSSDLLVHMLSDTLSREVDTILQKPARRPQIIYSLPVDSLYKRMMVESDNLIAEHLLLLCSSTLSDTLSSERTIAYANEHFLSDLPDKPIWMDGSGLSRYNLATPRSIVALLLKFYRELPRERLFNLQAIGGQSGTLKNIFKSEVPYIYAKSGSMSNVYCVSGYLVTKSGKTLVFSFMHNNFVVPTSEIKSATERLLYPIYLNYR